MGEHERALQEYLHGHIPLSRAMDVAVDCVSPERLSLSAPLEPNINHRDTVFGGSASALAILAAWSLISLRLQAEAIACRIVIQRNTVAYEKPVTSRFVATARLREPASWERFVRLLRRRGKGRIGAEASLSSAGERVGHLEGDFVAFALEHNHP